jgi:hypothetical protein
MSASEFALRAAARPGSGDWLVLVAPEGLVAQTATRVGDEIENLTNKPVKHLHPADAAQFCREVGQTEPGTPVVVSGINHFPDEEWRHLDLLRSRLLHRGVVTLVVGVIGVERLITNAPNVASWIGGAIWEVDPRYEELSEEERADRLRALRDWSGLTDSQVIDRASNGTLPNQPEFAEWLVLLDRADLIGDRGR